VIATSSRISYVGSSPMTWLRVRDRLGARARARVRVGVRLGARLPARLGVRS